MIHMDPLDLLINGGASPSVQLKLAGPRRCDSEGGSVQETFGSEPWVSQKKNMSTLW